MIETHPFGAYTPKNSKYLLLGSFAGQNKDFSTHEFFFYVTKRNQFWTILESVYNRDLKNKKDKMKLFDDLNLAVSDTIYQCERARNSNLDNNLINIVYNHKVINEILIRNKIEKIFFSSRFAEANYKKHFKDFIIKYPDIIYITLPSPSPRYAAKPIFEKIKIYADILPKICYCK